MADFALGVSDQAKATIIFEFTELVQTSCHKHNLSLKAFVINEPVKIIQAAL
jgi:hypothetical protein